MCLQLPRHRYKNKGLGFSVISIIPLYHGINNIHIDEMIMMMKSVFTAWTKMLVGFYLVLTVRLRLIAKIILHYRQRNANRLRERKVDGNHRWAQSSGKTMMTITAGQIVYTY